MAISNEAKLIAKALYNKSKRTFKYNKNDIIEQAKYFDPAYGAFIHKVISNNSLKISNESKKGYFEPIEANIVDKKLSKRNLNKVVIDICDVDVLPHELGHAVDGWFGNYQTLTSNVMLSNGSTLKNIFNEEFNTKQEEMYRVVMEEYKFIINSNVNEKAYDILIQNKDLYKKLRSLPCGTNDKQINKKRKEIQKTLYENGFVETYYLFYQRKCFSILNKKYAPILDALSSIYELNWLFVECHTPEYYKIYSARPVEEFFANLFGAKVTNRILHLEYLKKYLPKSSEAFEELFEIFHSHLMNNKRFTDVKTIDYSEEECDEECID